MPVNNPMTKNKILHFVQDDKKTERSIQDDKNNTPNKNHAMILSIPLPLKCKTGQGGGLLFFLFFGSNFGLC